MIKRLCAAVAIAALAACGGGGAAATGPLPPPAVKVQGRHFDHIILMIQENRSFDNFFATYPGAAGTKTGLTHTGQRVPLTKRSLVSPDIGHTWKTFLTSYDGGKMDGFDLNGFGGWGGLGPAKLYPYQYVDPAQIAPYWSLAQQYVLADHMFETQASGSFIGHQDLIAGGTDVDATHSLVNYPTQTPWSCDAAPQTHTWLLDTKRNITKGPFPCLTYRTLRDSLDEKRVSWKYYAPPVSGSPGDLWTAFAAIDAVRHGPEWSTNIVTPETTIFHDIKAGRLAAFNWLIPDFANSDHPANFDSGPSWVAQVVNAVGQSGYWKSTAIVVVWDDWGGFYDHVKPPQLDYQGLGFRVPMLVIAPYAKKGYVAHAQYEFGSILKFAETNFGLDPVGTTDVRAADFTNDFFDFSKPPRKFAPIKAPFSQEYFVRHRPSYRAVDDE